MLGDPGKNARRSKLPVDAYFPESNLIVEYREKQHLQPVGFMDKRITISGKYTKKEIHIIILKRPHQVPSHSLIPVIIGWKIKSRQ